MQLAEHTKKTGTAGAIHPPGCFRTGRLSIRRPVPADIDKLFELNANIEVTRWLHWSGHIDKHRYIRDFSNYAKKWASGAEYFWVIEKHQGDVIGYLASRRTSNTADIGFVIDPQEWGRGYATEAAKALISKITTLDGIERIVAICDSRNTASAKVLQKAGMTYQGVARNFLQCPDRANRKYDAILFDYRPMQS